MSYNRKNSGSLSEPYSYKDRRLKLKIRYRNYAIEFITTAFNIEYNIAFILGLLLKVKEVKLLKRVNFLKILDKMITDLNDCTTQRLMAWNS